MFGDWLQLLMCRNNAGAEVVVRAVIERSLQKGKASVGSVYLNICAHIAAHTRVHVYRNAMLY